MNHEATLRAMLLADAARLRVLSHVAALGLRDGWVGAGFVRNAVWDHLHDRPPALSGDIDVVWHNVENADPARDRALEERLRQSDPALAWSVKNQARMHLRNGDAAYACVSDAMRFWPETATAVAVRLVGTELDIAAPLGLDDLFALILRPGPRFTGDRHAMFQARIAAKSWRTRWPRLRLVA